MSRATSSPVERKFLPPKPKLLAIPPLLPPKDQNKIAPIVEKATMIAIISSNVTPAAGLFLRSGIGFWGSCGFVIEIRV